MPKCCFENFPSLKSSKARLIILNISFKIQLYRPNKHLYDTLVTTSSLQCKNILKNFVVDEKTAKIQQQEKSRSLSTFAEKHARASPFPHHTSNSATSARFTALYISALVQISSQSRTQSNACARARMALALGKLTTGTPKFRGSGSLSACTIDKR